LVVEDIVDTGKTMHSLKEVLLKEKKAKDVKVVTLLNIAEKRK